MINWINKQEPSWEGVFNSEIFLNDCGEQDLSIYIENSSIADYAEKCVKALNSLPDNIINQICKGIIKCAKENEFELPNLENDVDILEYCWFTAVYVSVPDDESRIKFVVEGEGEWGEVVGFVIDNNTLAYVGVDYMDNL